MVVCHCRSVNDRTVGAAIADGAASLEEIGARCGAGTRCGGCRPMLDALLGAAARVTATTVQHAA